MRIKPRRRVRKLGPLRFNITGLRLTSVTVNLGIARGVLWERKR